MIDQNELLFDIYVSVEIHFKVQDEKKEERLSINLARIRSLFLCFDAYLSEDGIKLYDGFNQDIRFPQLKPYTLSTLLSFDNLNYQGMQITERSFSNIIQFWNHQHAGYDMDYATFQIDTYENGKRP